MRKAAGGARELAKTRHGRRGGEVGSGSEEGDKWSRYFGEQTPACMHPRAGSWLPAVFSASSADRGIPSRDVRINRFAASLEEAWGGGRDEPSKERMRGQGRSESAREGSARTGERAKGREKGGLAEGRRWEAKEKRERKVSRLFHARKGATRALLSQEGIAGRRGAVVGVVFSTRVVARCCWRSCGYRCFCWCCYVATSAPGRQIQLVRRNGRDRRENRPSILSSVVFPERAEARGIEWSISEASKWYPGILDPRSSILAGEAFGGYLSRCFVRRRSREPRRPSSDPRYHSPAQWPHVKLAR